MPHLKSLYPDLPSVPDRLNVYETIIGRPEQNDWADFTVHVEDASGKKTTFKELRRRINDLATALGTPSAQGGLGLGTADNGELVGIMSENSSDYVVLVLALLKIATPFVLISCYSRPFELRNALAHTKVTRIFVASQHLSITVPVAEEIGLVKERIYTMNSQVKGYKSLEGFIRGVIADHLPEIPVRIVSKSSLAYLVFSSGTSGSPKGVIASQGNVLFAMRQAATMQRYKTEVSGTKSPAGGLPVSIACLPMHHVHGLHTYCFRSFIAPTRVIILPRWDTNGVLKAIPKYRVTTLSLVPSIIHQLVSHPNISQTDLRSILSIHSGAAYLPRELLVRLLVHVRKDVQFTEGYGMSETTVSAIALPLPGSFGGRFTKYRNATGVLLPGMEARIVRDDGTEADYDEVGELYLKGPNIVSGYWNNPKATEESFVDAWLRTGDQFKVDRDHYFHFVDRSKDILKVSGAQVSPTEIENVLLAHPSKLLSDATVAGVSGGRTADEKVPRAWVVLSENGERLGAPMAVQELEKWHQMNLSKYKWLRGGIEVIEEIPKSLTGKTLRRALQDSYEQTIKGARTKL